MGPMTKLFQMRKHLEPNNPQKKQNIIRISNYEAILIVCSIILIVLLLGIYATHQYIQISMQTEKLLNSVASQKLIQIESFFKIHLIEAHKNVHNQDFSKRVIAIANGDKNQQSRKRLLADFKDDAEIFQYSNSIVFNQDFSISLSTSENIFIDNAMLVALQKAGATKKPVISKIFNLPPQGTPGFAIVYGLYTNAADDAVPSAYIMHLLEAEPEFFTLLLNWPIPSKTAESYLICKNQDEIQYLSPLASMPGAALTFSHPLLRDNSVEAKALISTTGLLKGKNYHGKPVFAYAKPIPNSEMILFVSLHADEVLQYWKDSLISHIITALALLISGLFATQLLFAIKNNRTMQNELILARQLQNEHKKFNAFMQYMPSMIAIKDSTSKILFTNRNFDVHFPGHEWLGKTPIEIFTPEQAKITLTMDQKALQEGYCEYQENRIDKSGNQLILLTQKFRIDNEGKDPLIGQIITDITDKEHAYQEIITLNNSLERRVRERTQQLEASNAELRSFSYSIAHDLRSPLRAFHGYLQLLSEQFNDVFDDKGKRYLSKLFSASERMKTTIDDLLLLSKISSTEMILENVDLSELVNRIASDYIVKENNKSISLTIAPKAKALCDAKLANILIECLLDNSFKFSREIQNIKIEFGVEKKKLFFLRDNGLGFDMEYAEKLFQPFHRLHSTDIYPGNGIGLAIAKRIIDRHGGTISIESSPEQGTTVYFSFESAEHSS